MSVFRLSKRERTLARIAPISEGASTDRRMRIAVLRARRKTGMPRQLDLQQAFDKAIAGLVKDIPVSAEIAEWFRNEKLIPQSKRSWRKMVRNPAVLSVGLAVLVITGVVVLTLMQRMKEFPGSGTARKMLTIAASMRGVSLDPVEAEAGSLGDFLFMKFRLEHYDVPAEFGNLRTAAYRLFDDDEGHRVVQITVPDRRMQLFLFPAARNPKDKRPMEFSGWRFVEHEGWTGAVQVKSGVIFMAALRGEQKDLAPYLAKDSGETAAAAAGR